MPLFTIHYSNQGWHQHVTRMKKRYFSILLLLIFSSLPLSQPSTAFPATNDKNIILVLHDGWHLGGSEFDRSTAIAIDLWGHVVVVGNTRSQDFPLKQAFDELVEDVDGFITKYHQNGTILFSTFLGGSNADVILDATVDSSGNIIVAGWTYAGNGTSDFPIKNEINTSHGTGEDAFVVKIAPNGSLIFSLLLGGSGRDYATSVTVDSENNIIIVGETSSNDFPLLNAVDVIQNNYDGFITKLDPNGSLIFSTYLGGSEHDMAVSVVTDDNDSIIVTGETMSQDFPLKNPFDQSLNGTSRDAFITKITTNGSIVFSSFLGGSDDDRGNSITVMPTSNEIIVTGWTKSGDFPLKEASNDAQLKGPQDAFMTKVSPKGILLYSSYLGDDGADVANDITVAPNGHYIFLTGSTSSMNPEQYGMNPDENAFLMMLNENGTVLASLQLGGTGIDTGFGLAIKAIDEQLKIFMSGKTNSTDFLSASPSIDGLSSTWDAFIAEVNVSFSLEDLTNSESTTIQLESENRSLNQSTTSVLTSVPLDMIILAGQAWIIMTFFIQGSRRKKQSSRHQSKT